MLSSTLVLAIFASVASCRNLPRDEAPKARNTTMPLLSDLFNDNSDLMYRGGGSHVHASAMRIAEILAGIAAKPSVRAPLPYYESPQVKEPTCTAHWSDCMNTITWTKLTMLAAHRARGVAVSNVDKEVVNDGPQDVKIEVTETQAVLGSTTAGWKVGGKATTSFGKKDVAAGGVELSTEYSSMRTESTTLTKSVKYAYSCPSQSVCRVETLTFNADITGECEETGLLECSWWFWQSNTHDACNLPKAQGRAKCPQYESFFQKHCRMPKRECTLSTPVFENNGREPKSITAFVVQQMDEPQAFPTITILGEDAA